MILNKGVLALVSWAAVYVLAMSNAAHCCVSLSILNAGRDGQFEGRWTPD